MVEHIYFPVTALTRSGQAQFASNHLAVHDPAMTPPEREEIHARYREFANRLAASRQQNDLPRVPASEEAQRFRVDDEAWDFVEVGANLRCTNWIRRDLVEVGIEWSGMLRALRAAGDFSKAELVASAANEAIGQRIFRFLKDNHFIVGSVPARLAPSIPEDCVDSVHVAPVHLDHVHVQVTG